MQAPLQGINPKMCVYINLKEIMLSSFQHGIPSFLINKPTGKLLPPLDNLCHVDRCISYL